MFDCEKGQSMVVKDGFAGTSMIPSRSQWASGFKLEEDFDQRALK